VLLLTAHIRLLIVAIIGIAGLAFVTIIGPGVPPGPIPFSPKPGVYIPPDPEAKPMGRIHGVVRWQGNLPVAEPIYGLIQTPEGSRWAHKANPFAPQISGDGGVANAVVRLIKVPAQKSKPWTRGPVRIEIEENAISAVQDGKKSSIAFAKLGDEVELLNNDLHYNAIRARDGRGDEVTLRNQEPHTLFFTLPFPARPTPETPATPVRRLLDRPGRVEFTSGAGFFWTGADLFVCEHPYYTLTDAKGQFVLENVPEGSYEISAWLRPWMITGQDRDPENGRTVRIHFAKGPEVKQRVVVSAKDDNVILTMPMLR
jgi:hypothetical protein